nr:nucleotide-binding protein [uncultured Clostridium sp.]
MDKVEFIKSYIDRCDEVITSGIITDANKLQDEIIGIFESEITDIKNMLDNYSFMVSDNSNQQVDFFGDIKLIKQKLVNYMINLQDKMKNDIDFKGIRCVQTSLNMHSSLSMHNSKVTEFIQRGERIKQSEYHPAQGGFPISYVSGPKFDAWMGEINIFNERYLKKHPLHNSIHTTYFHYKKNPSSCDDMLGHLRALITDDEFFAEMNIESNNAISHKTKTINQLISDDILRCQQYLSNKENERKGKELYIEITGRYDSIINGFGHGLYSYYPDQHFYDPNISIDTINHNINLLLQKMISFQASNYHSPGTNRKEPHKLMSNKIFIVHGHDTAAKYELARTLEKSGFEAIILHEQASAGGTIIEKIEANTDVAYAVVLYTPCDMGRANDENVDQERSRARQNVVFEHGFLIGKLGRKYVSALVKGNTETPGDISGVVYITMDDAGAWKMTLAKELINAGLPVNMNKFCS